MNYNFGSQFHLKLEIKFFSQNIEQVKFRHLSTKKCIEFQHVLKGQLKMTSGFFREFRPYRLIRMNSITKNS